MIVFSNAKINVGLAVLDKREDGFHNLDSIFYPVPLCDIIEFNPAKKDSFTIYGIQISKTDNLIVKAVDLLRSHYSIPAVSIHLFKQIPLGAGLGGGSSNATHTLLALNKLFELNISNERLADFALFLGSDCPFFFKNTSSFVTGRGESIVETESFLKGKFIQLIYPEIHISTADAFNKLTKLSVSTTAETNWIHTTNDFQKGVVSEYPIISELLDDLKKKGAIYTSMSGTGSCVYGIFNEMPNKLNKFQSWIFKL
ncbi:MAG: 4-(cytidine 5'-diphospho)-2-C-methyl-D-erythritol kinase [Crocinitomicaceae bacterium]